MHSETLFSQISARLVLFLLLSLTEAALAAPFPIMIGAGHVNDVQSVAVSPDGRFALTGGADGRVILWVIANGLQLRSFKGHNASVNSVAFSHDGLHVLSASSDGTVRLWDVRSGREAQRFENQDKEYGAAAFAPDGESIVTGGTSGVVRIWSVALGRPIFSFPASKVLIHSVDFCSDGRHVVAGGLDKIARVWEIGRAGQPRQMVGTASIGSIACSPDSRSVVFSDGIVHLWSLDTNREVWTKKKTADEEFSFVTFSRDGKLIAATSDKSVHIFLSRAGEDVTQKVLKGPDKESLDNIPTSVAFTPDGHSFISGYTEYDSEANFAVLWDISSDEFVRLLISRLDGTESAAMSHDGFYFLTGHESGTVRAWRLKEAGAPTSFSVSDVAINHLALPQEGAYLLAGDTGGVSRIVGPSGQILHTHKPVCQGGQFMSGFPVRGVALSPDDSESLTVCENFVYGHDTHSGKDLGKIGELYGREFRFAVYSPVGDALLFGDTNGVVDLWNPHTGNLIQRYLGHNGDAMSAAFFRDGASFVSGGRDGTCRIWDTKSGKEIQRYRGELGAVNSVAISPDGAFILCGQMNGKATLWDKKTGAIKREFDTGDDSIFQVSFLPDGHLVFLTSEAGTSLWESASGKLVANLYGSADGEWEVVASDGRFDAGDLDDLASLAWTSDKDPMDVLPAEVLIRDYYTPGLLHDILKGVKLSPLRSIASIYNRIQPIVKIVQVKASQAPNRADVVVKVESGKDAAGHDGGVRDLRLFRDGQMVSDGYRPSPGNGVITFANVALREGAKEVTFKTYAFNADGIRSTADSFIYEVPSTAAPIQSKRRAWLLQIGVNHYAASHCELHYSVNDANELSTTLGERLKQAGFDVHSTVLVSETGSDALGASKAIIQRAITSMTLHATVDDLVFITFSGHGVTASDGQFYLLPSDFAGSCAQVSPSLLGRAISADELRSWLQPLDSADTVLVLDTCDSANSVLAEGFRPGPFSGRSLGQLAYDKGIRILAASQPGEDAREFGGTIKQGVLSYVLTHDSLDTKRADVQPHDGAITVREWLKYAVAAVSVFDVNSSTNRVASAYDNLLQAELIRPVQTPVLFDFASDSGITLAGKIDRSPRH